MTYQHTMIPRSAFRAYDIRGVIGRDLLADSYYTIGLALACKLNDLGKTQVYLGRDGRLTSNELAQALKAGLLESGIDVLDLGEVTTPVLYFASHTQDVDSGFMVTGSHNPAEYNGLKMVLAGKTLVQSDIDELYELVTRKQRVEGRGRALDVDIMPAYKARITSDIHIKRPLKVVVDCGNGIAGPIVPPVLSALGCELIPLHCEVDGRFPNHHPDPTIESNLEDLKQAVALHQADLGLAFDGDADRLGLITNKGEMIWPDRLMIVFAEEVLSRVPGATIVYDVKCSSHLHQSVVRAGGIAKMCPTGHSIVKGLMKREGAALAGEMSGHIFFKDRWYGFDDALYSACRLLEIVSATGQSVHELFEAVPNSINTPEIKIPIDDDKKFAFMARFMAEAMFPGANIITIDGLRVEYPFGWGLLRASNTTPCLIARFEADDLTQLKYIQQQFMTQLLQVDPALDVELLADT